LCVLLRLGVERGFLTVRNESRVYQSTVIICTPNGQPDGRPMWGKRSGVTVVLDCILKKWVGIACRLDWTLNRGTLT